MIGIALRQGRVRIDSAARRRETRILQGRVADVRQRRIEARGLRLIAEILTMRLAKHSVQTQTIREVRREVRHPHPVSGLHRLREVRESPALQGGVVEIVIGLPGLVRALECGHSQQIIGVDVPVQLGVVLRLFRREAADKGIFVRKRAYAVATYVGRGAAYFVLFRGQEEKEPVSDDRATDVGVVDLLLGAFDLCCR